MTTKLSTKNAYLGKRYKQISKRRVSSTNVKLMSRYEILRIDSVCNIR